jgi:hypothetical protein
MGHGDASDNQEPWYSARCVFRHERPGDQTTYEERLILLRAECWEEAIRLAEEEATSYAACSERCTYTGFVDLFHLFEREIGHLTEIFSGMRSSDLSEGEYLNRYFDSGSELTQRTELE